MSSRPVHPAMSALFAPTPPPQRPTLVPPPPPPPSRRAPPAQPTTPLIKKEKGTGSQSEVADKYMAALLDRTVKDMEVVAEQEDDGDLSQSSGSEAAATRTTRRREQQLQRQAAKGIKPLSAADVEKATRTEQEQVRRRITETQAKVAVSPLLYDDAIAETKRKEEKYGDYVALLSTLKIEGAGAGAGPDSQPSPALPLPIVKKEKEGEKKDPADREDHGSTRMLEQRVMESLVHAPRLHFFKTEADAEPMSEEDVSKYLRSRPQALPKLTASEVAQLMYEGGSWPIPGRPGEVRDWPKCPEGKFCLGNKLKMEEMDEREGKDDNTPPLVIMSFMYPASYTHFLETGELREPITSCVLCKMNGIQNLHITLSAHQDEFAISKMMRIQPFQVLPDCAEGYLRSRTHHPRTGSAVFTGIVYPFPVFDSQLLEVKTDRVTGRRYVDHSQMLHTPPAPPPLEKQPIREVPMSDVKVAPQPLPTPAPTPTPTPAAAAGAAAKPAVKVRPAKLVKAAEPPLNSMGVAQRK